MAWIGDVARSSYDAGRFQDAIRTSAFITGAVETALPSNDPKRVSIQKAAKEVEGWSYLRVGDFEKFTELASSYSAIYAATKDKFNEPTSSLPSEADLEGVVPWANSNPRSNVVYPPLPRRIPFEWPFDYKVK